MGSAYRLLPMMLPAAMPRGGLVWAGAVLVTTGVWALFFTLVAGAGGVGAGAALIVAGLLAFFSRVAWMLRHRRPPPAEMPRPDLGTVHAFVALGYLVLSAVLGLVLAFSPSSEEALRLTLLYGVTGLVGFLAQVVVGVQARLVPLFGWLWGFADAAYERFPPPMHGLVDRRLQAPALALWLAGVPLLGAGFHGDRTSLVAAGGWTLLAAVALGAAQNALVLRRAWDSSRLRSPPQAPVRRGGVE
jgi:putative flippase GtrA